MKQDKKILIFETLLFIYVILLKLLFIDNGNFYKPILSVSFLIILFIAYILFGYQKMRDNKKIVVKITIIILLCYLFLSFISGLFLGFVENQFDTSLLGIITNVYYWIIIIVCEELIRYMIIRKCYKKSVIPVIFITLIIIILDLFLIVNFKTKIGDYEMFLLITTSILPSIVRNVFSSYFCYSTNYVPGLVLRMFYAVYNYIFPIYPNIGYYITSVLGIVIPFLIYVVIYKYYTPQNTITRRKKTTKLAIISSLISYLLIISVAALVSGFFKYQIIAIGSGSMSTYINYGDAVILKHLNNYKDINN